MPVVLRTPLKSKELPRPSSGPRTRSQTKPPLNPVTTHFEFLGPHGTFFAILGLPFTTLALFLLCTENGCPAPQFYNHEWAALLTTRSSEAAFWWSWEALAVVLSWFTFQLALYVLVPGPWAQGTILRSGTRLSYKINAFSCFVLTLAGLGAWVNYSNGLGPLLWLAENYLQVCTSAIAFSTTLALVLYVSSFRSTTTLLAEGGNSGYPIYDFWIGRELNPRWTSFIDLKYFCELRPGLIGWTVLNLALAAKQYQSTGTLTNSMILVVAFQAYYVIDALWNERAILTTMDITTDGFGFMLVFGDLVWVPFTYTLQARYLTLFPQTLSTPFLISIVLLKLLGLYIFRSSNGEKNAFRTDPKSPSVAHLKFLGTKSGSRLLTSGWWGSARHVNYFGDWLMGLAWCLPCGFSAPIPYFYAVYFAILLIHRGARDEHKCRNKYGKDWDVYCSIVPYKFIPYVW